MAITLSQSSQYHLSDMKPHRMTRDSTVFHIFRENAVRERPSCVFSRCNREAGKCKNPPNKIFLQQWIMVRTVFSKYVKFQAHNDERVVHAILYGGELIWVISSNAQNLDCNVLLRQMLTRQRKSSNKQLLMPCRPTEQKP
jgi:hypothetical protein